MAQLPDPELAYVAWLADEEKTRQSNVLTARNYYDGYHDVKLTERQKEFLGYNLDDERFAVNYCAPVINATVERMIVSGFQAQDEALAEAAWVWWQAARMDALQWDVHLGTVRDGEYFLFVEWDEDEGAPRFYPHPRYTDPQLDGTGFGCKAFYRNDDPNQPLEKVSKRYSRRVLIEGKLQLRELMAVYYPDRTERYIRATHGQYKDSGWAPFEEAVVNAEGEEETLPAVLPNESGVIPWVHFRTPRSRSDLWDAVPLQDLINKTAIDIIAIADACGFPLHFTFGFLATSDGKAPESDGGNYLNLSPGAWVGTPSTEARHEQSEPADIEKALAGLDSYILKLAQITDTPTSRFQLTRQVAAEGTLKQQEAPLLAKIRIRQTLIGNGWENAIEIARVQANTYGRGGYADERVETMWEPAETRDEKVFWETQELKGRSGVPQEKLWEEGGYTPDEIAEMRAMKAEELQAQSNVGGELLRAFERGQV